VVPLVRAFCRQAEGPWGSAKGIPVEKSPHSPFFCAACEEAAFFLSEWYRWLEHSAFRRKGRGVLLKAFPWKNPLIHLFFVRLVKKSHFFYQSDTVG
jgi:hypothetical protein